MAKVGAALLAGAAALAILLSPLQATPAHANPTDGFTPGNIISDAKFYAGRSMEMADVQKFLDQKVGSPGSRSLSKYKMTTKNRTSDKYCKAYGGQKNESAARIITKVGQACGINQQVLLVMLQKEQSLVSTSQPSTRQINRAMGYACPDSGPNNSANCDTAYYGLFNQIYWGARQLKRYGMDSSFGWFPVNKTSNIQYHPNKSCGTKSVKIANKATAALHYYTPYTPNSAALRAGWGTGDGCSSYGNRNFYSYFKSWFGDPRADYIGREL